MVLAMDRLERGACFLVCRGRPFFAEEFARLIADRSVVCWTYTDCEAVCKRLLADARPFSADDCVLVLNVSCTALHLAATLSDWPFACIMAGTGAAACLTAWNKSLHATAIERVQRFIDLEQLGNDAIAEATADQQQQTTPLMRMASNGDADAP